MESKDYYLKVAKTFDQIIENFEKYYEQVKNSHPEWGDHDARLVIYRKTLQIFNGLAIGFSHIHRELINPNWFKSLYPKGLDTKDNQEKLCNEFETFLSSGVILFLYGAV